jgi:hypothetical protein
MVNRKKDPQNKIHMVNSFTTEFEKKRPTEVRRVSLNLYIYINIIYGESEKNNPKKWESFPETFRIDGSMQVQTFVSHWWGEEFKDLVASLDRYATSRCILRQRLKLWTSLHSLLTLLLKLWLV